ncbi:MAG: SET domain-containing protein-lysine N-methyltransferase [Promethearchaeia archaeon]
MSKVYVAKASNLGKGIFAKNNIAKDEIIFTVKGTIKKERYDPFTYNAGPNWLALEKETWIAPFDNNPWRYINHNCDPNAGLKEKVTVVAMKEIEKDEQVTIDYSITEADPYWRMKCKCGENTCRKEIRSIRFLPQNLFQKYKNYIPKYLKNVYSRSRNLCE